MKNFIKYFCRQVSTSIRNAGIANWEDETDEWAGLENPTSGLIVGQIQGSENSARRSKDPKAL